MNILTEWRFWKILGGSAWTLAFGWALIGLVLETAAPTVAEAVGASVSYVEEASDAFFHLAIVFAVGGAGLFVTAYLVAALTSPARRASAPQREARRRAS